MHITRNCAQIINFFLIF